LDSPSHMFVNTISNFSDNLNALRDFVDLIAPFLNKHQQEVIESQANDMLPLLLAFKKLLPEEGLNNIESNNNLEQLEQKLAEKVDIEILDNGSDNKTAKLSFSNKNIQLSFTRALKTYLGTHRQQELLYRSSLITLTSTSEWFISQILHEYLEKNQGIIYTKEKSFNLKDLEDFGSIEDARRFLIDSKVENLIRDSFEEWIKFFNTPIGLSMGYLKPHQNKLAEVYLRRNLIVHNGGRVNSIYRKKVAIEFKDDFALGDEVQVPPDYLDASISLFELNFILIASELWKKLSPEDEVRANVLIDIAFNHLSSERWNIAEGLSYFVMNDKQMPERSRLIGQLNYWQSIKWQGGYEKIRFEVEKADFSAKEPLFQLARLALLDENEQFFQLLPEVLASRKLGYDHLETWMIFREMRKDPAYSPFHEKYKLEFTDTKNIIDQSSDSLN